MKTLMDPRDAIGHKIKWHSWDDREYFILESVNDRYLKGILFTKYDSSHKNKFVLGKGIKLMTKGEKENGHWYLLEELKIFKISKLDDKLFEI
jgi:hypothetical protein